jgi:CheY-like chemotaxis protein
MARILVVDDVKFICQMMAEVLRRRGHQVVTAEEGDQAAKIARRERPDLIFLDIAIPGPDGLEVARRLKSDDETRHIPIMIVTSHNDRSDLEAAYAVGVDDYLIKPFETDALLEKTEKLLGGFRTNFSIDIVEGVPIVTVLRAEIEGELVDQLAQALLAASRGPSRLVLVDLSRMPDAHPSLVDAVATFAKAFAEEGGVLGLVIPDECELMRRLVLQVARHARVHGSREAALQAAGRNTHQRPSSVLRDPYLGVLVETVDRTTTFRIRRVDFSPGVFEFLTEEIGKASTDVLVELEGVTTVTSQDVWKLASLAEQARRGDRSFRIVNPEDSITQLLRAGGLESLVIRRTDALRGD